jgi:hypothetical protein
MIFLLVDVDNFLKDKKQGDPNDHICEAMPEKIRCLEEKSMNLPSALKMVAHKMVSAFKQQIFLKCKTTGTIYHVTFVFHTIIHVVDWYYFSILH